MRQYNGTIVELFQLKYGIQYTSVGEVSPSWRARRTYFGKLGVSDNDVIHGHCCSGGFSIMMQ